MFTWIQVAKDMPHHAFFIDHKSGALHARVRNTIATIGGMVGGDFVFLHDLAFGVR